MSDSLFRRADMAMVESRRLWEEHQLIADQAKLHAKRLLFTQSILHSQLGEPLISIYQKLNG